MESNRSRSDKELDEALEASTALINQFLQNKPAFSSAASTQSEKLLDLRKALSIMEEMPTMGFGGLAVIEYIRGVLQPDHATNLGDGRGSPTVVLVVFDEDDMTALNGIEFHQKYHGIRKDLVEGLMVAHLMSASEAMAGVICGKEARRAAWLTEVEKWGKQAGLTRDQAVMAFSILGEAKSLYWAEANDFVQRTVAEIRGLQIIDVVVQVAEPVEDVPAMRG